MEKLNKQQVIEAVKIAITKQEISFRGPRLLEMWHNGKIYLPAADIETEQSVKRLTWGLRGNERLKRELYLNDNRIAAVISTVSEQLLCQIDFSADDNTTVDDLCNAFLTALKDRLED